MLLAIVKDEIPGPIDVDADLTDLPIDSFGLLILRGRIEQALGREIPDETWGSIRTLSDILAMDPIEKNNAQLDQRLTERRNYSINMPQMAVSGLSESWLFKEIGDLHWHLITTGLNSPSADLKDGSGNRLYATFTRIKINLPKTLSKYRENDHLELAGAMSRFGAGSFMCDAQIDGRGTAQLLSNFSMRGDSSNSSLIKGQPFIPESCPIPDLPLPDFVKDYRAMRARPLSETLFETEYQTIPFHDLNGVGLIYFAAYPIISDICSLRHSNYLAGGFSTTSRDVYYFANADVDETLTFRIHQWSETPHRIDMETSVSRKSDGKLMAYLITSKSND